MTILSTATVCFGSNNNMPGDPDKSPGFGKRLKASVTKLRGDLVKRARNAPRPPLNLVKLAGLGVLGIFLYRYRPQSFLYPVAPRIFATGEILKEAILATQEITTP